VIPRSAETSAALYRDRRIAVTRRGPARRLARRPRRVDRAHRGTSLPLPLPSAEPLPFEPLFEPLRVDLPVVPLRRVVLLPLPVPVLLPLPASLAEVGVVVSGALPFTPLPVSVPLPVGAPEPEGLSGEPVRSGSFIRGSLPPGSARFGSSVLGSVVPAAPVFGVLYELL
jgi:hypothetical protein